ncbi:sensor histidine kinase [Thalassotalea castellviae]|uniref:histidine kinase n=1 Tax=Thalassotalea castellviae TaxID=3075612 RepID=A0ABU3A0K3_9GAMM|nr:HAMP domain-containing sensor histidine kinase [Thalassotalea sp. W431]MDT0603713.1 HAMP domain-containing sensor histidine kinase [Thalassotalea sp. W431]
MRTSEKPLLNYSQRLRRFRYLAIAFLLFLLIPLGTILYFGFQQIENNLLLEYKRKANKLELIVDGSLTERRLISNTLPVDAFDYYRQVYNPYTTKSQQVISPLSRLEYEQPSDKWLVGYFQYCNKGHFNSPIWLDSLHTNSLSKIEADNANLLASDKTLNPELQLRKNTATKIEQLLLQSSSIQQTITKLSQQDFSAKDEFFSVFFDVPDYFIFYRVVTVAEQYWLQGYIVKRNPYLSQLVIDTLKKMHFDSSILVELKDEKNTAPSEYFFYENVADGQVKVSILPKLDKRFQQQSIYKYNHFPPFNSYSLTLSTNALPMTSAMMYSSIFIIVLIIAILSACYGFYRLGIKQLALGEQRLNFVSSVSHELKTPLTSIRMYSQMLKEGTVISEDHQKNYFDFIYGESERLTRLINNILQLSTLSQQQQNVQPEYTSLMLLVDIIRSKTSSIIEKHGFQQNILLDIANAERVLVFVEQDAFSQVVINITDNAIKYFNRKKIDDSARQKIDFIFRNHPRNKHRILLEIRDYGEGITQKQEKKIFELFYRGGNELTRSTQGTGIGLALVKDLVSAQQGQIKVARKKTGLAMLLSFQCKLMDSHIKK